MTDKNDSPKNDRSPQKRSEPARADHKRSAPPKSQAGKTAPPKGSAQKNAQAKNAAVKKRAAQKKKELQKHRKSVFQRAKDKLFSNNKLLFLFSFLIAAVAWMIYSQTTTGEVFSKTISDVPLIITLPEEAIESNMEVFKLNEPTVAVKVTGNRLVVGNLTKDDIEAEGTFQGFSNIAGNNNVSINVKKSAAANTDFEIVDWTPSSLNVYLDRRVEKEFQIEYDNIKMDIENDYYRNTTLSQKSVVISGPAEKVKEIGKVAIAEDLTSEGTLTETYNFNATVQIYDSEGNIMNKELNYLVVEGSESVNVTVVIMPKKELNISPVFENMPIGMDISNYLALDPKSIHVAGLQEDLDAAEDIELDPIDFRDIGNEEYKVTRNIGLPPNCRDLSNKTTAHLTLDFSGFSSKILTITNFQSKNLPSGMRMDVSTNEMDVVVIGPYDVLENLTAADITAAIDLSGNESTGSMTVPITLSVNSGITETWVYGDDYEVNITLSPITQETTTVSVNSTNALNNLNHQ